MPETLLAELEAHAAREDETLYRWAESEVAEADRRSLRDVLRGAQHPRTRVRTLGIVAEAEAKAKKR